jgi:hypothetical protein
MTLQTALMSGIRRESDKQNPEFYMKFYCIIHQQSHCRKHLKSEPAMKAVVSVVILFKPMHVFIASFNALYQKFTLNMGGVYAIYKSGV